jgi:hypothetical protein
MDGRRNIHCLSALLTLADSGIPRQSGELRQAIDKALSCDRMIRCGQRLQCNWLAAELAETLRP